MRDYSDHNFLMILSDPVRMFLENVNTFIL